MRVADADGAFALDFGGEGGPPLLILYVIIPWIGVMALGFTAPGTFDEDELHQIKSYGFITAKPTMYVANVKEDGFTNNPHLEAVQNYAAADGALARPPPRRRTPRSRQGADREPRDDAGLRQNR